MGFARALTGPSPAAETATSPASGKRWSAAIGLHNTKDGTGKSLSNSIDALRAVALNFLWTVVTLVFALSTQLSLVQAQQFSQNDDDASHRLSDGDYVGRQRATLEMWRLRKQSRQAVQDAARDPDPEVAQRAEWILRQWRSGSLPIDGEHSFPGRLGLLGSGSESTALASVLEEGAFDAVLVAVEESAGTIEYEQIKTRVARLLTERFPIYTDRAFADGTAEALLKLMEHVAIDVNVANAAADLSQKLGQDDRFAETLPSGSAAWPEPMRDVFRTQRSILAGKPIAAMEHAKRSGDPTVVRVTRMLNGEWQGIASDALETIHELESEQERNPKPVSGKSYWSPDDLLSITEAYAWVLAGAARSNNQELRGQAIAELVDAGGSRRMDPETASVEELKLFNQLRWRALALHYELDTAIDVLAQTDRAVAALVACKSSRFQRAIELCGYPIENVSTELDQWIDDALSAQVKLPQGDQAPELERLYTLARILVRTGDLENAKRIYDRLTMGEILYGEYNLTLRENTILELDSVNQTDWLLEMAVMPEERSAGQRILQWAPKILGTEFDAFQAVLGSMEVLFPRTPFRARFQNTCQLFRGDLPDGFELEKDFRRLHETLLRPPASNPRAPSRLPQLDMDVVALYLLHGQTDLASEALNGLASRGVIEAWMRLAQREMENGNDEAAAKLWDQTNSLTERFTLTEAVVTADHSVNYAKTVLAQWMLARRAGHHEQADELRERLEWMLCTPSLKFRKEIGAYLREQGCHELAVNVLGQLAVLSSYGGDDAPDFFDVTIAYVGALSDFKEALPWEFERSRIDRFDEVRWSDLAAWGVLKSERYVESAYVSIPLGLGKTFLQFAIDQKNAAVAEKAIANIESVHPLDIDYAERLLPELRKAGLEKIADAALGRLMQHGSEYLSRFGTDATTLNNLAWTAAMNEKQIDQALVYSQRAVFMEPDSVIYRDTLAELLHLSGRSEEALAIESACLIDQPDEWHLHEQIEKYRKALGE